jgi:hypothetical protein
MTKVHVYKDSDGRLRGVSAEDERNQRRWRKFIDSLAPGEQAEYEFTIPRDPKQSAKFMAIVRRLLERTEAYDDFDALRAWIVIGAGYMVQDDFGAWVAKSLAWDSMDGAEFSELFTRAETFLYSDRARQTLWRHRNAHQHADAIKQLLEDRHG